MKALVTNPGTKGSLELADLPEPPVVDGNEVVFGSVNANPRHDASVEALQNADEAWLKLLITRRVAIDGYTAVFARQDDDSKVVLELGGRSR